MRGELFIMNNPVSSAVRKRRNYARINEVLEMPNLIEVQRASYSWFLEKGLKEIFDDISHSGLHRKSGIGIYRLFPGNAQI